MKPVIAILATLAVLTAGSASARDRHPSHRHTGAFASAAHAPSGRAATTGFEGWPTDYLIERFGGRQAQGSF
jgi:hypothetical protein